MQFPEIGEVVVCKIKKVLDYGVFVDLDEYEGVQGFVHISQVSSSWIKNIRSFVKENQVRAAKVVGLDESKNQVDLSFIRVTPRAQRAKIDEVKSFKRSQKLLEILSAETKTDMDEIWEKVGNPLQENFDSLNEAFIEIKLNGETAAKGVDKKFVKPLTELIEKNIEMPEKIISANLILTSLNSSSGVEDLKEAVKAGLNSVKGKKVEFTYVGSGKFHVKSVSFDYKTAEKNLKKATEATINSIQSVKGEGILEPLKKGA
ncbi:MAG: S1 RNA-binding domain-containing protein [Candidatus Diapherotrites archaeon]|nr:S1 RNA-binding domain-containing protein [Candidatus Diapherotrites archaeon]